MGDLDEAGFYTDEKTQFSVQYALLAISEAARRLGDEADVLCPGLPWRATIRGLGNWLRHGYDRLNPTLIWKTVQEDLAPLQLAAMVALDRLEGENPPSPVEGESMQNRGAPTPLFSLGPSRQSRLA